MFAADVAAIGRQEATQDAQHPTAIPKADRLAVLRHELAGGEGRASRIGKDGESHPRRILRLGEDRASELARSRGDRVRVGPGFGRSCGEARAAAPPQRHPAGGDRLRGSGGGPVAARAPGLGDRAGQERVRRGRVPALDDGPLGGPARAPRRGAARRANGTAGGRARYDVVVEATSTASGLRRAIRALAPGGVCTAVGYYLASGTRVPLMQMYATDATLRLGVSHARAILPELLAFVERTGFAAERVATLTASWDDAPRAYAAKTTKVVLERDRVMSPAPPTVRREPARPASR